MIFFTSDTHFNHRNIIKYCNRPFSSVEEHDTALVNNWNSVVSKGDTVYHLGDFACWFPENTYLDRVENILLKLNGNIIMILGNHDKISLFSKLNKTWETFTLWQNTDLVLETSDIKLYLNHYPQDLNVLSNKVDFHLHGHVHSKLDESNKSIMRLDVGVDSHNYRPISYDEVLAIYNSKISNGAPSIAQR